MFALVKFDGIGASGTGLGEVSLLKMFLSVSSKVTSWDCSVMPAIYSGAKIFLELAIFPVAFIPKFVLFSI